MKFSFLLLFVFLSYMAPAQSAADSLSVELDKATVDTTRINILIELSYKTESESEKLAITRQAYNIGKKVTSIKHKSRSEILYGVTLMSNDLDSGALLIESGAQRYLSNKMMEYAANAYYLKAIAFGSVNRTDSAIFYYERTYEIASENNIHPEWGNAAYALASIYNVRGKNVEALKWAFEAQKAFQKGERIKELGQALNQIGIIYDQQGVYSKALENYLRARELAEAANDINGEILINNNIGVIYDNMNNSEMAIQYYKDALEKARIHNLKANEATLLNNLSYVHLEGGDTAKAISLLRNSLKIDLTQTYPCFESYPLEGMGSIYLARKKIDSAAYFLFKAERISEACEDALALSTIKKVLGQLYTLQKKYDQAREVLNTSLRISRKAGLSVETKEVLEALYQHYKVVGETDKALIYMEKYLALSDSIYEENNVEKTTQIAAEYEFRKQVNKLEEDRAKSEKELSEKISLKTAQNKYILITLCITLIFVLLLVRGYYLIRRNNAHLKFLNDEKNKLIGVVAHDLRNPLNMIKGLTPLIYDTAKQLNDEMLKKYVEVLEISSEKMASMIDRVLDISAIENMTLNVKNEKVDLKALIQRSVGNFQMIAKQKKIKINTDFGDETYHSVLDANYMEQVLDNLFSNAIKFSEKGKKIDVTLDANGNENIIKIKDYGPGISEEEKEKLFQPFTTLSNKPTDQERSTGLGLSIALKFIQAMGGKIDCESKLGEGTSFVITFPKA